MRFALSSLLIVMLLAMSSLASSDCLLDSVRLMAQQDPDSLPPEFHRIDLSLSRVDSNLIQSLRNQKGSGGPRNYLIDQNNSLYVTDRAIELPDDKLTVGIGHDKSKSFIVVPKEVGVLFYNEETKKIEVKPTAALPQDLEALRSIHAKILADNPDLQLTEDESDIHDTDKVLECADLIGSGKKGMALLRDRLVGTTLATAASIIILDPKRLEKPDGAKTTKVDLLGANLGALTTSVLFSQFQRFGVPAAAQGLILFGRSELMSYLIAPLYKTGSEKKDNRMHLLSPHQWGDPEKMFWYNTAFTVASTAATPYVEKHLMRKISDLVYNQCMSGAKVSILLSPTFLRIYERTGWTLLYIGARKLSIHR